jgi:hypothetical protein
MRRWGLAAALILAAGPSARGEPPASGKVAQSEDDEAPPAAGEGDTIQPGKRPQLHLAGKGEAAKKKAPADEEPAAAEPKVPTSYQGVTPGAPNLPPRAPRLPVKGPARMTWPGFQVRDGVPTVFLELTSQVEWSVAEEPGKLVYTLKDTTVHLRNNQRPLKVTEFGTPVKQVDAKPKGRDVKVTIALKHRMGHKERTEEAAGGYKLLLVELQPQ